MKESRRRVTGETTNERVGAFGRLAAMNKRLIFGGSEQAFAYQAQVDEEKPDDQDGGSHHVVQT